MEPFLMLGDIVKDYRFVDESQFRMVSCKRKKSYGCGPLGDAIAQGLTLFVRIGRADDPNKSPKLCLAVSDRAFEMARLELDGGKEQHNGTQIQLSARIYSVDEQVMVLRISFVPIYELAELSYYLVYDSADESLSLLPRGPPSCQPVDATFPLKAKVKDQHKYSLILMTEMSVTKNPVLCLWSPPPPLPDLNPFGRKNKCPWGLMPCKPVNAGPFEAHVVFSFKGNAVWGDLAQGILYCDCCDINRSSERKGPVDFKHIKLPEECRTTYDQFDVDMDPMPVYRNMGCVGDSIWFVIIEPSVTCPGETKVKVWTLEHLSDEKWNLHREFTMQSVWKLESFRALRLPKTVPEYPILRQPDGCTIYMLLRQPYTGEEAYAHLVCIDLSSSCEVRVLSAKRLIVPLMERPVVVCPYFFPLLQAV